MGSATRADLHDPAFEHDGCGVACIARLGGEKSHETVEMAVRALVNLEHRGAAGADAETGDGAGILLQLPDAFLREAVDFDLPAAGRYAVGVVFLERDRACREHAESMIERVVAAEGQTLIGWRDVPVVAGAAGERAEECAPVIKQVFVGASDEIPDAEAFERKLYVLRRLVENEAGDNVHFASLSTRTMVLKGMLAAPQLERYFPDLRDPRLVSALAIVHSRFSTNTFPSWALAHPYRYVAHNGEFNTLRGNVNWMKAREKQLGSPLFGPDLQRAMPTVVPGASDSFSFDNVLELLVLSGRSLPHAVMTMIPEAWEGRTDMPPELQGFYEFHSRLMEPWDGPASVTFSDGRILGATLDRNGLRPGRWALTDDGWAVLASETGAFGLDPERVVRRGRLKPGSLWIVDVEKGELRADREEEMAVATRKPYAAWAERGGRSIDSLAVDGVVPQSLAPPTERVPDLDRLRTLFGYTREDVDALIAPLGADGKEPNGSMGNDAALAVLSDQRRPLFAYFKQLFAQVTNPAIDPVREDIVMSLATGVGEGDNLLMDEPPTSPQIELERPLLLEDELRRLVSCTGAGVRPAILDATWPAGAGVGGLQYGVAALCTAARCAIEEGATILVISDRAAGRDRAPIPSLLAVAAVHASLVRHGVRLRASLVVDSGEPREVHHFACLIGYGATAVHPWLMLATLRSDSERSAALDGIARGLLKTMSKMGISTVSGYRGAQAFEAVGVSGELIRRHFTGTASRIGGIGYDTLARDGLARLGQAYATPPGAAEAPEPPAGGLYRWRRGGEQHGWNPDSIVALQRAVRTDHDGAEDYTSYSTRMDEDSARRGTLRGLLRFREDRSQPVPLHEVEPAAAIVKRFATGAMSLGSISPETHETLAVAMNRLGGKSNTGEGGEDPTRWTPAPDGDSRRSSIKQVASGRFGVTVDYLVNADELQIKIAQGSKPGEGGQLPGGKVDGYIGKLRFATPGVELISPPPHHDIYSIEDLKQLIHDLRVPNPSARISVKLAAEAGVGTVAAGVVKGGADHVVIAGHDGGTGASALSSIQNAGVPWELGLAETQQTLVRNGLRSRVVLQVDGQLKTGRDVVVGALLGAEEFGFSTAPLIALGCIMMRVCHLNTCPVGIATQNPELRERFAGRPEHVVRFMVMVAEEVRAIMARLGVREFDELVGRADFLEADPALSHPVDVSPLLAFDEDAGDRHMTSPLPVALDDQIDCDLIRVARDALEGRRRVRLARDITNLDRSVGGMLSGEVARRRGPRGLPEGAIEVAFSGSAGQSFGTWLANGVTFALQGDANDYAGKGLSGGVLSVAPDGDAPLVAEHNVIAGNAVLYGATAGRAFFSGTVGERFAVRNSGAHAVVEGVGDHGCEYMTGGVVAVLGPTGRNFAAGMSGGIAYVLDADGSFSGRCNVALVDLEDLDQDDTRELHDLVMEHLRRTGSPLAARLLSRWYESAARFTKVMPRDYARVLRERSNAGQKGASEAAASAEAAA